MTSMRGNHTTHRAQSQLFSITLSNKKAAKNGSILCHMLGLSKIEIGVDHIENAKELKCNETLGIL